MALSKVAGVTPEITTAPAESTKVIGSVNGNSPRRQGHDEFKSLGESIGANMTAEEKALEGTKRGAVAFVCALGDPRKRQDRAVGREDGKQKSVPCWKPVGYKFKALEDIMVPQIPLKENNTSLIDVAVENATEVPVKAGEEFILNLREYGTLISKTEYNGVFNGEGKTVYLGVTFSGNRSEPYPIMRAEGGSVKTNMELIADEEKVHTADGREVSKYTVKPEYADKFGVLFKTRSISRSARSGEKSNEKALAASNIARALQDYYSKN